MLNIEALLAPVSPDQPCGEDLAFSPEVDEIARARQADDPSLEQGAWVTALKEADWKFVGKRCALLIEARSKDLQLGVWLAEASAKTGGAAGLAQGLGLLAALCERYWDGLYPLADEDGFERRIGNLAWIAARTAPLVKGMRVVEGGAATLLDWEAARAHGGEGMAELEAARARSPAAWRQALLADLDACLAALDELERVLDARLGIDGPSFSPARAALRDLADVVRPGEGALPVVHEGAAPGTLPAPRPASLPLPAEGPLQHREQALAQLRQVAQFFRRTEPHSPVAYLAEKAARWGEQPLHAWLRSVIKDDASLARLEELLGIEKEEAP
ncbi:type VI secretion system protein TssA [Massilia niastensis]|uniref:type VI secretion system protein TssA n=1 Tax=Massilia niastensis TaxID=544911 RepID=UPI0003653FEE|nr:type VI secretion system protein TssA [Massilia niastensis]